MELAVSSQVRIEFVRGDGAVSNLFGTIKREDLFFGHALKQVAKTVDDDLMTNNQHTLAAIVARDRLIHASQPQDDIAPTLAARRSVVKLAERRARFRQVWIFLLDADARQAIKDAEFPFAQSLVRDE